MKNRGWIGVLVSIILVLILTPNTTSDTNIHNFENIEISVEIKNQDTIINIQNEELKNQDLTEHLIIEIRTKNKVYTYNGKIIFPILFFTLNEDYTITIYDKKNNEIVHEKIVSQTKTEQETKEEACELQIQLEKNTYKINEIININIIGNKEKLKKTELIIQTEEKTYKTISVQETLTFIPSFAGEHHITLICAETNEQTTMNFLVEDSTKINPQQTYATNLPEHIKKLVTEPQIFQLRNNENVKRLFESRKKGTPFGQLLKLEKPINAIENIVFKKLVDTGNFELGIEDREPVSVYDTPAIRSYAIDPTKLDFETAKITAIAEGNALYECKEYDFETQTCYGYWQKKRDLIPGEMYSYSITPEDPLYSELNNTIDCSCSYTQTSNNAQISCSTTCTYTVQVPENALTFFLEQIQYNVAITMTSAGTITAGSQSGHFDNDDTNGNGNEILVGSSTVTSSTTTTWTNNNIDETGSQSFNQDNCDNWPNYCTYYIHLDASLTFTTPGNSQRESTVAISLNWVNHTLNYTEPGDFSVVLENPENDYYTRALPNQEFEYIPTSVSSTLENCSLYTNEGGWNEKNSSTSIANGTSNYLTSTFSNEGTYLWNVYCWDDTPLQEHGILNRTIYVDRTSPNIYLLNPPNETTITDANVVSFYYNVTDSSPIANCSLIINGTSMNPYTNVERNIQQTINQNLQNGVYEWSILCYDNAGNYNESEKRTITIDIIPMIYTGQWFETSTSDCSTLPCEINLAQQTDGTQNNIAGSLNHGNTITMIEAISPFIGSNGAEISSSSTVNFVTYYSARSQGGLTTLWYLYKQSETGTNTIICSNTGGVAVPDGGTSTGSCTVTSDTRLLSTDKLYYEIHVSNAANPPQTKTFTHLIDYPTSYFNATGFTQIGTLSTVLIQPNTSIMIGESELFNLTCEVTCEYGSCLNTNVYAQTNQSGTWQNIAGTGTIILASGQSNPENEGTIYNTTNTVTFELEGNNPGSANVRCRTESKYSTANSNSEQVIVGVTTEPVITLNYPSNNSWINDEPVLFLYTPTTYANLNYCAIYINGALEDTDNNPTPNVQNSFSVSSLSETNYNWSVTCEDENSLIGNSSVYYFDIDRQAPYNLTIYEPEQPLATITQSWVDFEWIVQDLRSENLTCNIYIDSVLNQTINTYNNTLTNTTIEGFNIGNYTWYMNCEDQAGNTNTTSTYNITITDVPPTVSLISPMNYTGINVTTATLEYMPYDGFGINQCTLYVNEIFNQTNTSINANILNYFEIPINEQEYNWSVECTDTNGNNGTSPTWIFFADYTPPSITLNTPLHDAYFSQSNIFFSYTPTDNWAPLTCTINFNETPINTQNTTSGTPTSYTEINQPDGYHEWNVMCLDVGGNTNTSETRNLTINQSPTITLNTPLNNVHTNLATINFTYTPIDNDGFNFCELYINELYNQTNATNVTSNTINNFLATGLNEGYYNWSVMCQDSGIFSNTNTSINRTIIVDRTPPNLTLLLPQESQIVETSTYNFTWITNDYFSDELICNIYVNDLLNQTSILAQNNTETGREISGFLTGNYNWSMTCTDLAGNQNISETINFEVLLPPKITLISPVNDTGNTNRDTTFTYIPSEGSGSFDTCSLILNGITNQTNTTITANTENSFSVTNMPDGKYEWNVQCTDTNTITGSSPSNWIYYIDNEEPYEITLLNPLNETIETKNNVSFSFIAKDLVSPQLYCDIFLTDYESTPFTYSLASNVEVQNNTMYNHHELLSDGNYSWSVLCVDKADLFNESIEYFFEVIAPPNVTLINPLNNTWFDTNTVVLTYYPEDDFGINQCDLILNGEVNQTNSVIFNEQNNTFTLNSIPQGEYNWTVACTDNDGNTYAPPEYYFFIDMENPSVTTHNPLVNESFTTSTILFNWTATDTLSPQLYCDLYINSTLNLSNIQVNNSEPHTEIVTGFNDGIFNWSVTCRDLANNSNTSTVREFEVQEPPIVILGNPINNHRTNITNINLFYTATDNSGLIDQCTLILNGQPNETNTNVVNGVQNNFSLTNLEGGTYSWDVLCEDPNGNTGDNGTEKYFHIDLFPPIITLISPYEDQTFNENDITFYWNATDFNSSIPLVCELYVTDPSGDRFIENITGFSEQTFNTTVLALDDGEHFWNVTCRDDLNNENTSSTWRFIINQPDLYIDNTRINFNNTNPDLLETINITANVSNIGGVDAINALVQFWQGNPDEGGIQIGNMTKNVSYDSWTLYSVEWTIPEGYHNIYVLADPLNEINELNETNNNATTNISVLRINIHEPLNEDIFNYQNITFNFTAQDYTNGLINYSVFIDNVFNGQQGQILDNQSMQINITIPEGTRQITIQATDYLFRQKNATITLTIDLTPPVPIMITGNETWFNTSNPEINITATDNLANNITYNLYINNTINASGFLINNTYELVQLTNLNDGTYSLILEAIDTAGNLANNTETIIYIDTITPTIQLNNPADEENFTVRDVLLNYTVFDNMAQTSICYINVSGTSYGPFNVNVGEHQTFLVENLSEAEHYWNVTCSDQASNNNISETRSFNVFIPPVITLITPLDNYWSNLSTNTFTYFVSDDTGIQQCSLYLKNVFNQTNSIVNNNDNNTFTVNNMLGEYIWRIQCTDNTTFNTLGISNNRTLFVDLQAPNANITTANNTWFNTPPTISFNVTDDMANNINYTILVNGTPNVNGTAVNNTITNRNLEGLTNGTYEVQILVTDLASNTNLSNTIIIYYDTVPPNIILNYPANETITTSNNVNLSFNASDNMAQFLMCTVNINADTLGPYSVDNGDEQIVELTSLAGGYYYWNVTCVDQANNQEISDTWWFFVPVPDLSVDNNEIYFNETNIKENDLINITATIRNIGVSPAENFIVQFWQNEVNVSGNQIGNNISVAWLNNSEAINVSVNFVAPIGTTEIFVYVNPDQAVTEDNYSNNIASRNLSVEFWHYALGTTNDTLRVTDASLGLLFDWNVDNSTGSNIYVTDYDSDISWTTLQALGRDTSNNERLIDFELLDTAIGSDSFGDSVNNTYTNNGAIMETVTFEIFSSTINNVPVVNSTTTNNFKTGILWDYQSSTEYTGTESIVFITSINKNQLGYNNNYNDFEIRIPATLREYQGPDFERVVFYTEIR